MIFSTIIPIYNAAHTLRRCIDGFVSQTFRDFELLLVNDGSTDSSLEICLDYAQRYPFVKVIDKENGGVSSARNAGMEAAQSEFITFADADDEVTPVFLKNFSEQCNAHDLLIQSISQQAPDGRVRTEQLKEKTLETADQMATLIFTLYDCDTPISVYRCCFRNSIIKCHRLQFDERIAVCEDVDFVLRYMHHCSTIHTTKKAGYLYHIPPDTKTYPERNALRTSLKLIEDGFLLTNNEERRHGFQQRYVSWCMAELLRHQTTRGTDRETVELATRFATLCLPYLQEHKPQTLHIRLFTMLCVNSQPTTILRAAKVSWFTYKILHTIRKIFPKAAECHTK